MTAFFISLREGLEAALIVGILLGTLRRLDQRQFARYVWLGVAIAVGVSIAVAAGLSAAGVKFEGQAEELYEGVILILAAMLLTGMIFWMQRQGSQLHATLEATTRRAVESNGAVRSDDSVQSGFAGSASGIFPAGVWGIFALAFVAVMREGVELALLLVATSLHASTGNALLGAILGIAVAILLGAALYAGVLRLNLGQFFRVTNIILLFFAAGMVGLGVHELIEAGVVPAIIDPVWNINSILNDKSAVGELLKGLFGYNGNPALTEILAYAAYLAIIGWMLLRTRRPAQAHRPTSA
jgi:high-affinity iron transporter